MAHYAKVDKINKQVVSVIVADQDFIDSYDDQDAEYHDWIQCSYNTYGGVHYDPDTGEPSEDQSKALRKNYPRVGDIYDYDREGFYQFCPYKSWILDEETFLWSPPVEKPEEYWKYEWNENLRSWVETTTIIEE